MNSNDGLETFHKGERFAQYAAGLVRVGIFDRESNCDSDCPMWKDDSVCKVCVWQDAQTTQQTRLAQETNRLPSQIPCPYENEEDDNFCDSCPDFDVRLRCLWQDRRHGHTARETNRLPSQVRAVLAAYHYVKDAETETRLQRGRIDGRRVRLLKSGDRIVFDGKAQYFRPRGTTLPFVKGVGRWQTDDMRLVDYGDLQRPVLSKR